MSKNNQVLIEQIIKQEHSVNSSYKSEDDFFEFFTASQILRDYDLSYDQIEDGICGNTLDGGVDSMYIFVNGDLICGDENIDDRYKRNADIELVIIQSKNERSFGEDPITKLLKISSNLLDLEFDPDNYADRYNSKVLEKFGVFRNAYLKLITKKPKLQIRYFYTSKGIDIHPNVTQQAEELKLAISSILTDSTIDFTFVTATNLVEIYRKRDSTVFNLKLQENPLSSQGKVFISLVKLHDYFNFITDGSGQIIKYIFESNVRDYQGKTSVNQEIKTTLEDENSKEDFWWLNNGVTILATDVLAPGGKELIIHDPEIVNGLQTSNEIYLYFQNKKKDNVSLNDTNRSLLVRVIVPENEVSRDKIIRATNSQTPIPKASLRATDSIHRDIEDYFKPRGFFYDRRKNFYKNEGKKPADIVGLPFLAQCLMAITMHKPDTARARPSTLLEDDASYEKLYDTSNNINSYYIAALIGKKSEHYLRTKTDLSVSDKNNLKFYLAFVVSVIVTNSKFPSFRSLENMTSQSITDDKIEIAFNLILERYCDLGGGDKLAKGNVLIRDIK
ncbi:AIPR family protein [Dickeya fangzhongdai]|uniref:AIPR family protein n=1 Tax=Dickeya fangzhongdai TaxID=1778540 RepID=UPI0026E0ABBF|nr:AIPR family protein [Dickeya fangzhongdai]WKV50787.1 AIPR family protein [Dickeya fangzhongdai]